MRNAISSANKEELVVLKQVHGIVKSAIKDMKQIFGETKCEDPLIHRLGTGKVRVPDSTCCQLCTSNVSNYTDKQYGYHLLSSHFKRIPARFSCGMIDYKCVHCGKMINTCVEEIYGEHMILAHGDKFKKQRTGKK